MEPEFFFLKKKNEISNSGSLRHVYLLPLRSSYPMIKKSKTMPYIKISGMPLKTVNIFSIGLIQVKQKMIISATFGSTIKQNTRNQYCNLRLKETAIRNVLPLKKTRFFV